MKKISKLIIVLVAVVMFMPIFSTGCSQSVDPFIVVGVELQEEYFLNEEINLEKGSIEYTNSKGKTSIINLYDSEVEISNFNTSQLGTFTMTITYKGCSVDVEYVVTILHDVVTEKGARYYSEAGSIFALIYNEKNNYTPGHIKYVNPQNCIDMLSFGQGFVMFDVKDLDSMQTVYDAQEVFYYTKSVTNRKNVYSIIEGTTTNATITVISANQVKVEGKIASYDNINYTFTYNS